METGHSARVVYPNGNGELQQKTAQTEVFFFPWKTLLILAVVAVIVTMAVFLVRRSKDGQKMSS
jgi:branched-subunit amino acid ABC-type transport system permease component